jgi:hypothetical protein
MRPIVACLVARYRPKTVLQRRRQLRHRFRAAIHKKTRGAAGGDGASTAAKPPASKEREAPPGGYPGTPIAAGLWNRVTLALDVVVHRRNNHIRLRGFVLWGAPFSPTPEQNWGTIAEGDRP